MFVSAPSVPDAVPLAAPATADPAPAPGWSEPQYSPVKIDAVVQALSEAGVLPAELLAGTGIDATRLQDPDYLTSTAQLCQVLRRAVALRPLPDLGRRIGEKLRITGYGMYGYALLSAPTMRAAMDRATRFHALANPLVPIRCERAGPAVAWLFPERHELLLGDLDEPLYRVLIELQMTIHQTLARDVMGPWCVPDFVGVSWPEPPGARAWAATFGCCPAFGAARCELRYPAAWLDRAPQLANAVTAAQTSRECARLLASLRGDGSMAQRVYRELTRVPGQFPDLEAVATRFCVTSRTLRRHLQAEGTSYAELLTRVRRALAEDYLRGTRMSVDDIAAALAFSDGRSFRHAFVRWTGHSPSDFRRAATRRG